VLPAKLYYLEQLKDGPVSHRIIMNRMSTRFHESPAAIKDALVAEGYIVCVKKVLQGNGKYAYHHQLTGKSFVAQKQQPEVCVVQDQEIESDAWEDGTVKSTGNAFNWRNKDQAIFTKREVTIMQQNYTNHPQITVYSRA
jgi:hypothetical protein